MEFEAKLDRHVQMLTVLSIVILGGIYLFMMVNSRCISGGKNLYFLFLILALLLPYIFAPRKFIVNSDGIGIKRIAGTVLIPWGSIKSVKRHKNISFGKGVITIFGSQGLYGYFGLFRIKNIGKVYAYLTSIKDCVLIETKSKKYLLSPYPVDEFLYTIQSFSGIEAKEI